MKKSTWVIATKYGRFTEGVNRVTEYVYWWEIHQRAKPGIKFTGFGYSNKHYARRDSALRGARRMAKALRISAEVE